MIEQIKKSKIVPLISVDDADDAVQVCAALAAADLKVIEITFRAKGAVAAIAAVSKEFPDFLVGAGTVLTVEDLKRAQDAGATFAVAPGGNPTVIDAAIDSEFAFFPGVANPTDVEAALEKGIKTLKFFPAEALGGCKLLKAMIAPYKHTGVQFIPTGGVSADNMNDYLSLDAVAAIGGSWIAPGSLISDKNWSEIEKLAREARALADNVS